MGIGYLDAAEGQAAPARDLFGDPIVVRTRGRGRPAHEATAENRQKVTLWLAMGRSEDEIAEALDITPRTLGKHYFHELRAKRSARMRLEGHVLAKLVEQVDKGNAAAASLLDKKIQRAELGPLGGKQAKAAKPVKLGKKEAAILAAREGGGDTPLGRLIN